MTRRARATLGSNLTRLVGALALVVAVATATLSAGAQPAAAFTRGTQSDGAVYGSGLQPRDTARVYRELDELDGDVDRVALRWGVVAARCGTVAAAVRAQPDNGCYDWGWLDAAVSAARTAHPARQVIVSVREPPCWLWQPAPCISNPAAGFVGATAAERAHFTEELRLLLHAAVARYGTGAQPVRSWTIWNEPNAVAFWSETPTNDRSMQPPINVRACHFAQTWAEIVPDLRTQFAAFRPEIALGPVAPSITRHPYDWLAAVLAARAGTTCTDAGPQLVQRADVAALAIHPYPARKDAPPYELCQLRSLESFALQCVSELRTRLDTQPRFATLSSIPLWALETGYEASDADPENGVDPMRQALWLSQTLELLDRSHVAVVSWYPSVDGGELRDWQSGLLQRNARTRRPSWLTFQAPLAVRAMTDGTWEAWTTGQPGIALALAAPCSAARGVDRLQLLPATGEPSLHTVTLRARFSPPRATACVVRIDERGRPDLSAIIGLEPGSSESHLITSRVIDNAWNDPRGDVIDSRAPAAVGNPRLFALIRDTYFHTDEPSRIDPNLS